MGTIKCPNCGLKVSDAEGECFACGYRFPKVRANTPVKPRAEEQDDYYYEPRPTYKPLLNEEVKEPAKPTFQEQDDYYNARPTYKPVINDVPKEPMVPDIYVQEKNKLQAQYDFKREQDLLEQKKREEAEKSEHQQKLDAIPLPNSYGDPTVYVKAGVISFVLFIISLFAGSIGAAFFFVFCGSMICGIYWLTARSKYKKIENNVVEYKEQQLAIQEQRLAIQERQLAKTVDIQQNKKLTCPKCGSTEITSQVFQENRGSTTTSNTKFKMKQKGHGCLWWLCIGWWWWIADILLWIFLFLPRLIIALFYKKKQYVGSSKTNSATFNMIDYKTIHTCQNCGHTW